MKNQSKIITVLPVITGSGAKYSAVSIAYGIRQKDKNARIALLDLDLRNPYLLGGYLACEKGRGLDTMVAQIEAGVMDDVLFKDNMSNYANMFDVLRGSEITQDNSIIKEEHIAKIFELARKNYDYIITVVAPDDDNAGTVYGLFQADVIVLVIRPNYASLVNLQSKVERVIERYKNSTKLFNVIFNMRSNNTKGYEYEAEMTNMLEGHGKTIGEFKFYEENVDNANLEGTGFRIRKNGGYETECLQIANELISN